MENCGRSYKSKELGFDGVFPSSSEVGVYDFKFCYEKSRESYVNIKSSVLGRKTNKDDISKAKKLIEFYTDNPNANLYVATFIIKFNHNMTIGLEDCIVFPTAWIPDIYVNPSNNGNLQSSQYKNLKSAVKRTNQEFLKLLIAENNIAKLKKYKK